MLRLSVLHSTRQGDVTGSFIEDDDGMGYADIGEEEDWATERAPAKKAKTKRDKKSGGGGDAGVDSKGPPLTPPTFPFCQTP